jgi:hypothetical protein
VNRLLLQDVTEVTNGRQRRRDTTATERNQPPPRSARRDCWCPSGAVSGSGVGVVVVAGLLHERSRVDDEGVIAIVAERSPSGRRAGQSLVAEEAARRQSAGI